MEWRDGGIGNDRDFSAVTRGEDVLTSMGEQAILNEDLIGAFGKINGNFVHARSMQEIPNTEKNCFFPSGIKG